MQKVVWNLVDETAYNAINEHNITNVLNLVMKKFELQTFTNTAFASLNTIDYPLVIFGIKPEGFFSPAYGDDDYYDKVKILEDNVFTTGVGISMFYPEDHLLFMWFEVETAAQGHNVVWEGNYYFNKKFEYILEHTQVNANLDTGSQPFTAGLQKFNWQVQVGVLHH